MHLVTDPPYFAAIPYGDLSNVFYVWKRELIGKVFPSLCSRTDRSKDEEIIVPTPNRDRW